MGMSDMTSTKPFVIAKRAVWEAYQQVKANRGAAGIDEESLAMFEQNLSRNLYKLWNRMSSGSYFPPPVKQVEIPKAKGGTRKLGIPTVSDRIAQTVVKRIIEPTLDPIFHQDSYGYRPGNSAKQAVAVTRKRCWQYAWVVEFDIKSAFDQIDHGLLMKAVGSHIKEDWITSVYRTVANRSVRDHRRRAGIAATRQTARRRSQSYFDEPVHALRVRCLDATHQSILSVCPLCR
jgi:RNA-directed DNA polymerase